MRLSTSIAIALFAVALPAAAQFRPIPRPPVPLPATSPAQFVKIAFHTVNDTNATRFQGMDAYFADGTVTGNWKIPAGKQLVLTDFSISHYLVGRYTYDLAGQVEEYFPSGASLAVFPIAIKAGQQHVSSVHALTTGLAYSQADGPNFALYLDTPSGATFQANSLWAFGYLVDAN